ncbi:MAG: hypothetical protein KDI74_01825 [Gammaproteobacteria bacterium]|nr:hypothetical protein [Gammaproteobacteria bacterium]HXK56764.1 hypothetical protein [Gammaproteobacteria bacterium]
MRVTFFRIFAMNPQRYPGINYRGAGKLIDWITSEAGQHMIANFMTAGTRLFTPSANTSQVARH